MANPAKSIFITCVSPLHPGTEKLLVLGSLSTSFPMKIASLAISAILISILFLNSETCSHTPSVRSFAAAKAEAPKPIIPYKFSVPDLRPCSWPPPLIIDVASMPSAKIKAPTPLGPPIL